MSDWREFTRAESLAMRKSIDAFVEREMHCPVCKQQGLQSGGARRHAALVALVCDAYCRCGLFSTRFMVSSCTVCLAQQQALRDELGPGATKSDLVEVLATEPASERSAVTERRSANERRGPRPH